MFPVIHIDISDAVQATMMTEGETKNFSSQLLGRIVDVYSQKWMHQIDTNLHQTKREYLKGVDINIQPFFAEISLLRSKSKMAMDLEEGKELFDIKDGFENSSKRKFKAGGGWYLTVPFRHATSDAVAESGVFSGVLPKSIEKIAKSQSTPIANSQLPTPYDQVGVRLELTTSKGNTVPEYVHKSPIYEGLKRIQDDSGKAVRGQYITFRRVSDKSDKFSWIHPGFTPYNLMGKAWSDMDLSSIIGYFKDEYFGRL